MKNLLYAIPCLTLICILASASYAVQIKDYNSGFSIGNVSRMIHEYTNQSNLIVQLLPKRDYLPCGEFWPPNVIQIRCPTREVFIHELSHYEQLQRHKEILYHTRREWNAGKGTPKGDRFCDIMQEIGNRSEVRVGLDKEYCS